MTRSTIFIGHDPRPAEVQAFAVARQSIRRRLNLPIPIRGVVLGELRALGLYTRPMEYRPSAADHPVLWDMISDAPCSTQFAISRFLVPTLAEEGWALFVDADVMARTNLNELFQQADPSKAVMVVKHDHRPSSNVKMDGQIQTSYERKNWSSVMLFNCDHPATKALTPLMVNTQRGLWLHQLQWLADDEIGELHPKWNWIPGVSDPGVDPGLVHFSLGTPAMPGYENTAYAEPWWQELELWAK